MAKHGVWGVGVLCVLLFGGIARTLEADDNGHYFAASLSPGDPGDGDARRVPDGGSDWNCAERRTRRSCGYVAHRRFRGLERRRN